MNKRNYVLKNAQKLGRDQQKQSSEVNLCLELKNAASGMMPPEHVSSGYAADVTARNMK